MARKKKDPRKVQQVISPEAYGIEVGRGSAKVTPAGKNPVNIAGSSDVRLVASGVSPGSSAASPCVGSRDPSSIWNDRSREKKVTITRRCSTFIRHTWYILFPRTYLNKLIK